MTHNKDNINNRESVSFSLECDLKELDQLHSAVEMFGRDQKLTKKVIFETNLVLEEIFTNIVSYGHEDSQPHKVHFSLKYDEGSITILVEDDGKPFNLLETEPVDLNPDLEQRSVGGLGIHLVRKLMDNVTYQRIDGKNIVTLLKKCKN